MNRLIRIGTLALVLVADAVASSALHRSRSVAKIIKQAKKDDINLECLPFAQAAFKSINAIYNDKPGIDLDFTNASKIDTHVHAIPDFWDAIDHGDDTLPSVHWDVKSHLEFMATNGISHAMISISAPGSVVFPGNQTASAGLARLLNEWLAALVDVYPERFSFYGVVPLPYTAAAIKEGQHVLSELNSAGIGLLTNHEGLYLGNPQFRPFFSWLDGSSFDPKVIMIHPTSPFVNISSKLENANPTPYPDALAEFYFETARTFMDLVYSQTLQDFSSLRWTGSHVGGAFPAIEDRILRAAPLLNLSVQTSAREAINSRVWWDSAGATYPSQVQGLLAYDVPKSRLTYGSDFPYDITETYVEDIDAIEAATFLTEQEKEGVFFRNAESLYTV